MITTIQEAKDFLRRNWEKGADCPCCNQHVQLYRYSLFALSAVALIELFKLCKDNSEYFHVREFAEARNGRSRASHFAELRFWGLVEAKNRKTDIGNASGYWRITEKGRLFVKGEVTVSNYVHVYNNKCSRISGEQITIKEALKNEFDYNEVMNWAK